MSTTTPSSSTTGERKQYQGYCTDLIGDFTLDFLKHRDPKKPFFLMCHHKAPHRPWQPAPKYENMFADQNSRSPTTSSMTTRARRSVGRRRHAVGENMTKTDLKQNRRPSLKGDALRKWAYQLYIKDYLRCIQSRGR